MKKLTDKSKRALTVAGIGVVCVALIIGISYRFSAMNEKTSDVSSSVSSPSSEVVVAAVGADGQNSGSGSSDVSSSAASQATAPSGSTDQKIQPDVSKPSAPSSKPQAQGSITNPSQKPSYSSKDTTVSKPSAPQNGDKKDGKIYIEGFGWVQNNGGGGSGKTVSGNGDINKQVGQMD